MSSVAISVIVFACVFGGALLGARLLRKERHQGMVRDKECGDRSDLLLRKGWELRRYRGILSCFA